MKRPAKQTAIQWVDDRSGDLSDWNQTIWHYGETAWREYKSAAWYVQRLRTEGFEVEEASGGMPTALAATWTNGDGPTVMAYAEYDGLPGNCQKATTHRAPRKGLSPHAGGHTDPHSALGMGGLGGILAAKAAMQELGLGGTLKFMGEPAEKVRGSKPIHAAHGYYDGVDAIVSFHPCYMLPLSNTTRWDTHCGPCYEIIYTFLCEEPETWLTSANDTPIPVAHTTARAPGANDAVVAMYTLTKMNKESMLAHTGGWSINEAILASGQATGDNLPAQMAQILYTARAPSLEMLDSIIQVLDNNAEAAAAASHCTIERNWVSKSRPGLANHVLADVTYNNLAEIGAPKFGPNAIQAAQEIQKNLGLESMDMPYLEACENLIKPQEAEKLLRRDLPEWQTHSTSDDYTDMCWQAPTARLYIGRPMMKAPPGYRYPDWAMNALGGIPACIDPMILTAAKTIAMTLIDFLTEPGLIIAAREEFNKRTGGGIGGDKWIPPLCDYEPPLDFPWPEYITTARGEEWWIPARKSGCTTHRE
ncbi:MAG: amidohydrolase [Rhodospirillaceae bacterium]|nr:amidohydrolase [Rhodospirillaceae bacterium]